MPWKHNGRIIRVGKAWVADDNSKKPGTWASWTDEHKKASGLVWEDPPASAEPFDNRFYLGRKTDGSLIEKDLTDINVVDEDGKAVIDPITGKQVIQLGLKTVWITKTKQTANDLLSNTDWMVTRKSEKGTAIPDATTKYRDSVRTACNTIETKINACSNLTQFMALFDAPSNGSNPPMFDFPQES
tara:strand:+ start:210 stop:767 length:558 start_codon:yes stop_codon:yes gene_type:complete